MKNKIFHFTLPILLATGCLALLLSWITSQGARATVVACTLGPHKGAIISDQTWCAADNPHIIDGDLSVNAGVTLTLEAGVVVKFNTGIRLDVYGSLNAVGDAGHIITFTSNAATPAPGDWQVIDFHPGSTNNHLEYTWIGYGGSGGDHEDVGIHTDSIVVQYNTIGWSSNQGIFIQGYAINFQNNVIHDNASEGLYFYNIETNDTLTLTHNTFINNSYAVYALWDTPETGGSIILAGNTSTGSSRNGFGVQQHHISAPLTYASDAGFPFILEEADVRPGGTLNISPGTIIKFPSGASLNVDGTLNASGTADQPIIFTSIKDDSHGGDTDGVVGTPAPGDWGALKFTEGSHGSVLDHTWVGYGGGSSELGDIRTNTSSLLITHSTINLSAQYGIFGNTGCPNVQYNDIRQNADIGFYLWGYPSSVPLNLIGNTFTDNTHWAAYADWGASGNNSSGDITLIGNTSRGSQHNGFGIQDETIQHPVTYTSNLGFPFVFDQVAIQAGGSLSLAPGTVIKFIPGSSLQVDGRLNATGTASQPIAFTSLKDDLHGGDTNGDTYTTSPNRGDWGAIKIMGTSHDNVIEHTWVGYGGGSGEPGNLEVGTGNTTLDKSVVTHSGSDGIYIGGNVTLAAQNLALIDNADAGLGTNWFTSLALKHITAARNTGSGFYIVNSTAAFTNTILAANTIGMHQEGSGGATLANTLWDANATAVVGNINETGHQEGAAWFTADGYHITRYSAAIGQGVNSGVIIDIDDELRPSPAGTQPDLGADEYLYTLGQDFAFENTAYEPQWVIQPDPLSGEPYGLLRQRYFLHYFYGSPDLNPPDLEVTITDTLPGELGFESQTTTPMMDFQQQGQTCVWQPQQTVSADGSGEAVLTGQYDHPEAGHVLTNQAELTAGDYHFAMQATTTVPIYPPLITFPGNGEICPDPAGLVVVRGMAQGGAILRLYEGITQVVTATATASGAFTLTYTSAHVGIDAATTLAARACAPSDPSQCSAPISVTLTAPQSYWDPQRSTWEGTPTDGPLAGQHLVYQFRDSSGNFSSQNWVIPGVLGFYNTNLHLFLCTEVPTITVIADGVTYLPSFPPPGPEYPPGNVDFNGIGGAHHVEFHCPCGIWQEYIHGHILIDPDGYVFDVTQGFDPLNPTLHTIQGVTVTAYVSMPEWGGWIPWPAQLYNNQVNPQVTGQNGYFAFFTPPGSYYLQVEGKDGYQSWRSPVVQVITDIVHVNVPLTPWSMGDIPRITLTPNGPDHPVITIMVGDSVEWIPWMSGVLDPDRFIQLIENPVWHVWSYPNPLSSILGWDSGMLAPGQSYHRQFTQPGVYFYTDGQGYNGKVVVIGKLYLPMVRH